MPRELKPCGTVAAAKRHRRNGQLLDPECQMAEQEEKNSRAAKKRDESRVAVNVDVSDGRLDELTELRSMYTVLSTHMRDAPPQSIAAIVRQADAVLVRIKEIEGTASESSGGLLDGFATPSAVPANVVRFPGAHVANG